MSALTNNNIDDIWGAGSIFRRSIFDFPELPQSTLSVINHKINVNVEENDDHYCVTADLPGVDKENIDIRKDKVCDMVVITVTEKSEKDEKRGKMYLYERFSGSSSRSVAFRRGSVDWASDATAKLENGVLSIVVQKLKEDDECNNSFNKINIE